ncbi:Tubulin binding cofactor C [Giardia lamblia P15]|uniref:Tubulin binding cofactor C n=1 Tax=Giardia intestinalis (strain P15) TaxID=658858 RepID=E1F8H6_GIAIA|nr:Tubulin binding cofactor C [Giardia lamblia P15]
MCHCMRMTLSAIADLQGKHHQNCLMYVTSRSSCVHDSNTKTNKIAPYNYIFPSLEDCLQQQGLVDICQQGESFGMRLYSPLGLGVCESLIFMDPKTYCTAVVPFDSKLLTGKAKALPIILPSVFRQTMKERSES